MRGVIVLAIIVTALVPSLVIAQTPNASAETVSCRGWVTYAKAMADARRPIDVAEHDALVRLGGVPYEDYTGIPPQTLRTASEYLNAYAARLERVDVPDSLLPLHSGYVERVVLMAHIMDAHADGDLWAMMLYTDQMTDNQDTLIAAVTVLSTACPMQWDTLTSASPVPFPMLWDGWADTRP